MAKMIVTTVAGSTFQMDVESYETGVDQALFFMEKQAFFNDTATTEIYTGHQIAKIEIRR
jgi:hypothetical protein